MSTSDPVTTRYALIGATGAALTAISGVVVQAFVLPASDVSDELWSYPWPHDQFVAACLAYAVFHVLTIGAVLALVRSGRAGAGRATRIGLGASVLGLLLLTVAELASIPVADRAVDDAVLVGALFGVSSLIAAIGIVTLGVTTLRAGRWTGWGRFTPLAAGLAMTSTLFLAPTPALAGAIGVFGLCLLAMCTGLATGTSAPVRRGDAVQV